MINNKKVTAIILSAGNSSRYNINKDKYVNKNFELILDKPVLFYSIDAFNKNSYIDNIIISVKAGEEEKVNAVINMIQINKKIIIVLGGKTRKESVYNCLKISNADNVIIHDGARPFIKQNYINDCLMAMKKFKGVTLGVKSKDTIKLVNKDNIVINTTKRDSTYLIQTPQCFDRKILLAAHEKFDNDNITDDCILLEKNNYDIKIIDGDYQNIKLTTADDLKILELFIKENSL